jgi:hypothetical protein
MADKRGFMAIVLGVSLLLTIGCDDEGEGEDEDEGEVSRSDAEGELVGCSLHETTADCMDELGCAPVFGNALVDDGDGGWCTQVDPQFIGCVTTLGSCSPSDKVPCEDPCPAVEQILCDGANYWRSFGCVPNTLTVCDTPAEGITDC